MPRFAPPRRRWHQALIAAVLAGASAAVCAAPYAISYKGTIANSIFPEIKNGEAYSVTFVFDNDGTSANSQQWAGEDLTCTIWRMNTARNVSFAQNLVTTPPSGGVNGSVTTDAAGNLTGIFSTVTTQPTGSGGVPAGAYSSIGITLTAPVAWYANSGNNVLYDSTGGSGARTFGDAAGDGVQMNIANWSAPLPYSGENCDAPPLPATVAPVPTLGEWSLALLGLAAAGLGARRLRRRG